MFDDDDDDEVAVAPVGFVADSVDKNTFWDFSLMSAGISSS